MGGRCVGDFAAPDAANIQPRSPVPRCVWGLRHVPPPDQPCAAHPPPAQRGLSRRAPGPGGRRV